MLFLNCGMYLFFDTETTGLPRDWKAPVKKVDNWPRMVELAWILADGEGNVLADYQSVVKPAGYVIPSASTKVHGISQERALREGRELGDVLGAFAEAIAKAEYIVAHNVSFDEKIAGAEFIRAGMPHLLWERESICTKLETTDYCALPGKYGYKWPTLAELHLKVFGEKFDGAHTAMEDVRATMRCFFALKQIGVV